LLHRCRSFSSFLLLSGLLAACSGETIVAPAAPAVASTPGNSSSDSVGAGLASTCATATSHVTIAANLDADAPVITDRWSAFDPFAATNYVTSTPIVDALGNEHDLSVVFRKTGPHAYEYHALVDSYVDVASQQGGTEVSAGTLSFTAEGALDSVTESKAQPVKFEGIGASQSIAVDFGTSIDEGGTGFTGTISVAASFATAGQWHDGASCGATPEIVKPCVWPRPLATSHIVVEANLDARMDLVPVLALPWNAAEAVATSNFTISTTVYDSLGATHAMGLHFRRTSVGTWDYHAVLVASGEANITAPVEVGAGTLSFEASGALAGVRTSAVLELSFSGAMPDQLVTLDFGSSNTSAGGAGHMTELATASASFGTTQDGRALTDDLIADTSFCD
jgi:flagellar hook protein FlgE